MSLVGPTASQATVKAAEIAFFRSVISSAKSACCKVKRSLCFEDQYARVDGA